MQCMVAGAGAAYLGAGLGPWEFAYTAITTCITSGDFHCSYVFIGIAWLLHTGWDIVHHLYAEHGSCRSWQTRWLGCAICNPVIALWCLVGTPSLLRRGERPISPTAPPGEPVQPTSGAE